MLPAKERLKRSHLFTKAYNARKAVVTPYFTLYVLPRIARALPAKPTNDIEASKEALRRNSDEIRTKILPLVGFVTSKKISKSACQRNRMKRRIRESYRLLRTESLSQWYVMILVIKENARNATWTDLCRTMETAFAEATRKYGCK